MFPTACAATRIYLSSGRNGRVDRARGPKRLLPPPALPLRVPSLYVALFLSGAAALVHQATWGRMLHRVFGVGDLAVATVLAAFFLGLGLGSWAGGRWGARARRPALTYALLEAGIGAYALASVWLIPRVHSVYASVGADASFGALTFVRLLLALAILLPPTILMGATLPILVAVVADREGGWSGPATRFYATNTFGAMLGAAATGLWLVPTLGARAAIMVAATGSIAGGALVLAAWWQSSPREPDPVPAERPPAEPGAPHLAVALAALAGVAALAGEVLWTRVLRMILQGTTQAFSIMLANYLAGIAIGSVVANRLLVRGGRPARLFGVTQALLATLVVVAMMATPHLPRVMALMQRSSDLDPTETWVILVVSSLLLLPLAIVLGTSIPLAWRLAGQRAEDAPRYAGRVLAANTLGGLVGSLLAGFALVPLLGMEVSLLSVAGLHVLAASVSFQHDAAGKRGWRVVAFAAPLLVGAAVLSTRPSIDIPFLLDARHDPTHAIIEGPGEPWSAPVLFLEEGRNTTVSVLSRDDDTLRLFNDGRPESGFGSAEPGFGVELAVLGSLPTLFAERRERAMVVGLGAGHTTTVLLAGPWARIDVVELEGSVVDAARMLHEQRGKPFPLDDERTHLIVDDARARMVLSPPDSYDAIVSQPSHPWLAGSSALYTIEFFEEARRVLRPGGVVALWVNLFRIRLEHLQSVVGTLHRVFPHVHGFVAERTSLLLVAGDRPMPLGSRVEDRIAAEVASMLAPFEMGSLVELAAAREIDPESVGAFVGGAPLVIDDRPVLEFELARVPSGVRVEIGDIDRALADVPWIGPAAWAAVPAGQRTDLVIERLEDAEARRRAVGRVAISLPDLPLPEPERALLEGAVAEARGDVRGALLGYDRSTLPDAAYRADRLRYLERMYAQALAAAERRSVAPPSTFYLMESAFALGTDHALSRLLALAEGVAADQGDPLLTLAGAYVTGGCPALLSESALAGEAPEDEHVAFLAQGCAFEVGRTDEARRFAELRSRARRASASAEARAGREAEVGGNHGAAMRHFRRALAHNPAHGVSAASLARLLHDEGRRDEATEILRRAYRDGRGLPTATQSIEGAAAELSIDLSGATAPPPDGPEPTEAPPDDDG